MKTKPVSTKHRITASLLLAALLGGCAGVSTGEGMADTMNVLSAGANLLSKPTSAMDMFGKIHSLNVIIATVEKYQSLNQQQKTQVERIAQQRYDRIVTKKRSDLAPTYKAKKQAVAAKALPPEKKEKELAKVDKEWYAAAQSSAKKEYGTGFAVPVKNASGKEVVAFARIDNGKAVAASDAYVVAEPPKAGSLVAHSGGKYTVVNESIRMR